MTRKYHAAKAIPLRNVKIDSRFWSMRQTILASVTVPYMEKILRDEIPGAEKSHALENFRIAAGDTRGEYYGMVFQDSDVYKWMEAAAYSLCVRPDAVLRERLEEVMDLVSRAQMEDGYLNTWFILREPEKKWTNMLECHELYCAGHLLEAAAACCAVLGETRLTETAVRLADHIVKRFENTDEIPGHQEIEIGLMRLYEVTGKREYAKMALAFLDRRGKDPDWFRKTTPAHAPGKYGGYDIDPEDNVYNQTYLPVREQFSARGHAVRMMYMLIAMADAARFSGDLEMMDAVRRILEHTVQRKMYVTGGLGASAFHESFSDEDFFLPNDSAYNETCASVAAALLCRRLLLLEPEGAWADLMEREMYNGALAGMQLDGKRFFYVNPLEMDPDRAGKEPGLEHVLPCRPEWYSCACCPPNLARLVLSLGGAVWTETEDTVFSHLFVGSHASLDAARIDLKTEYPWEGTAVYTLHPKKAFRLAIHIPEWAEGVTCSLNGKPVPISQSNGYLYLEQNWQENDRVAIRFDLYPRRIYADPRVQADTGKVCVALGPVIYCLEEADQPEELDKVSFGPESKMYALPYEPELLGGIRPLLLEGTDQDGNTVGLRAIPYYAWANRGISKMTVWIRERF